ncbi:Protein SERAC1 [Fusarium austroafricanum]|uniref:Protein SERAC1 n=1 Tax=Fusarium austroafricanum TaxID=2364996 RepID=A0A8H4KUZ9_9HYPO|nr:Protein SERAC1 [Fusarium austroafricanum]
MDAIHIEDHGSPANLQQVLMPNPILPEVDLPFEAMDLGLGTLGDVADLDLYGIPDGGSPNDAARRISRAEWNQHKEIITANYAYKTLPALQEYMAKHHAFTASTQQWKKKLREWKLAKNLPRKVARFVGKRGQSRLHKEGKKTKFNLGGQPVPMDKVKRHMQAYEGPPNSLTGSTPDGLSYATYKSPAAAPVHLKPSTLPPTTEPATSRDSVPLISHEAPSAQPVQMAFWNGRDLDDLLEASRNACQLATDGEYLSAKPIYMDCLDGLEVLLTPTHATFLNVLQQYVSFAVSNQDFNEATARVHKSYNDHKEKLGSHDKKVWQCLARLGLLYYSRGFATQAIHMLVNARQGLLVATSGDTEEAYSCVSEIVKAIISISIAQDDFDAAERELLNLIAQVEELGGAYQYDALIHKHELIHLYFDNWSRSKRIYGHTPPNRTLVERLLLEIIEFSSMSREISDIQTCSWDKLRKFYHSTGQRDKLESLLPKLEGLLTRIGSMGSPGQEVLEYKQNMINSFLSLGHYEKAEWWLLRVRDEVKKLTVERIAINMRLARMYFQQQKLDSALLMLREAQWIGSEILPRGHEFHSIVTESIKEERISEECCPDCHVNLPGAKKESIPNIYDFIGSEGEINCSSHSGHYEDTEDDERIIPQHPISGCVFIDEAAGEPTAKGNRPWKARGQSEPWPKILLPSQVNKARILSYGYDAYVVSKSSASSNRLVDHATNLLIDLTNDRISCNASSRPLIFVAHSLGGLVCKEAVLLSRNNPNTYRQGLFAHLKGIAFMGTPHKGSWMAEWAKIPVSALGLVKSANKSLLKVLETDDQLLESIQLRFLSMVREQREKGRQLHVTCFFEELPLPGYCQAVSKESSTFEGYDPISIHANHADMVKFSSVRETGFKRIVGELKM